MWILLPTVVVEIEGAKIVSILDQQLQRLLTGSTRFQRVAENIKREPATVDGHQLHAGPNDGAGSVHSFDRVFDLAIFLEKQANGKRCVDLMMAVVPGSHHLSAPAVVNQLGAGG